MPSTTKRIPRIPGTTSDRRTTKSRPQLKIGKRSTNAAGLSKYGQLQCRETIPPPCSTRGLDLTGLKLEIITGYEIIARYGVNGEFSLKEKIRALMLYKCIRHLPGYIEKEFDDVNKAMCHVFRETDRLIKHTHGFIIDDNTRNKIPDCYSLQIIYETFENHFDGRWQSYCNVKNITKNDLPLRKAIIMCLHLVIYDFHFTLFDKESTYNTMSVEDWLEWQYDQATDRLNEEKNEFFKKTGTKFKLSKHGDSEEGTDVIEALEHINEIDAFAIKRKKEIQPMQNRIRDAKPNLRFIKKQAERLKGTEVSIWLNHIVTLKENGFKLHDYIANSYRDIDSDTYDDDSLAPTSAFGYIYDGDDIYSQAINSDYQSYAENYCIAPFATNMVIDPEAGIVYETPDIPLGDFINKIFLFSFETLSYETH